MKRIRCRSLTLFSLMIFTATIGIWARSYFMWDCWWAYVDPPKDVKFEFESRAGRLIGLYVYSESWTLLRTEKRRYYCRNDPTVRSGMWYAFQTDGSDGVGLLD